MTKLVLAAVFVVALPSLVLAQPQSTVVTTPGSQAEVDSQAHTAPGTITSPNADNAAIAKIEAAGKNPSPARQAAQVHEPGGADTAENNNGGR
jgi:hypothetical protein